MANGNGGPSRSPRKTLVKRLQYTEKVLLNNNSTDYAYYSKYLRPNLAAPVGAAVQFAAYELFRLRRFRVSIQMALNSTTQASVATDPMNVATAATVWTAADWGANETISGESIMQYQNAKKNTISLNKWTKIVDSTARVNGSWGVYGASSTSFVLPADTWVNTAGYGDTSLFRDMYSGYQLFIQVFGMQSFAASAQPSFTMVTELEVEFLQPAFQNNPSAFTVGAFGIKMVCQPNSSDPTELRTFIFDRITIDENTEGVREMSIRLKREDGQPGSLTFTAAKLREAIESGTSGDYYGGRPIIYDGPYPPVDLPSQNLEVIAM